MRCTNKLKILSTLLMLLICLACEDETVSQEQEEQQLEALFDGIQEMANSKDCEDSSNWTFTAYGQKACGGPVGYIAYSTQIDTAHFLDKVDEHRAAQQEFNEKWGIASDCSVPQEPDDVICENGDPSFVY